MPAVAEVGRLTVVLRTKSHTPEGIAERSAERQT